MRYIDKLLEMGISESRTQGLYDAMNKLNSELCKLDLTGLHTLTSEFGIIGHLDQFAQCTGDRNVAREIYQLALNKAERAINLDDVIDFGMFSDMLHYSAEQAAQLEIPGAKMLCKSLRTIRRRQEGKIGLSFSRLAARVDNVFTIQTEPSQQLEVRLTNKYVGTYRHMDDWSDAGDVAVLARTIRHEDMDGTRELMFVRVWSMFDDRKIMKALVDTFSWSGCACEHDCCGCTSQSVNRIKPLDRVRGIWLLKVSTSRNI